MSSLSLRVVLRTDSGVRVGSGHVIRCLTLAHELRGRGATAEFACREHAGNLIALIESEGFVVHRLAAPPKRTGLDGYAAWLGVSQASDAAETRAALAGRSFDWLIVDHYALDREWESALRPAAGKILVIDDIANRGHDCDMLLDQNYFGPETGSRYDGLVNEGCVRLLGPGYALLRPEYRLLRALLPVQDGSVRRVVVFFGSSDSGDCTSKVVEALTCPELAHLGVEVVLGGNHPDPAGVRRRALSRSGTTVHVALSSLAGLMVRADLAIGAGGTTTWERACLGVPSLVATVAENQEAFTRALAAEGFQVWIGDATSLSVTAWREKLIELLSDPKLAVSLATRSRTLVDGFGAPRVVWHMLDGAAEQEPLRVVAEPDGARASVENGSRLPLGVLEFERCDTTEVQVRTSRDPLLLHPALESRLLSEAVRTYGGPASFLAAVRKDAAAVSRASLRVTFLTDPGSWVNPVVADLAVEMLGAGHRVRWVYHVRDLIDGDVCFILSFEEVLRKNALALHRHNLVVHASALPQGKGWSPMTWQILEGRDRIPLTLFEADVGVDSGPIYLQEWIELSGAELVDEWRRKQSEATRRLCLEWMARFPDVVAQCRPQSGTESRYPRRRQDDSRLDPRRTLAEQFDLLRVVDNERYPAWFELRGCRYRLSIREVE